MLKLKYLLSFCLVIFFNGCYTSFSGPEKIYSYVVRYSVMAGLSDKTKTAVVSYYDSNESLITNEVRLPFDELFVIRRGQAIGLSAVTGTGMISVTIQYRPLEKGIRPVFDSLIAERTKSILNAKTHEDFSKVTSMSAITNIFFFWYDIETQHYNALKVIPNGFVKSETGRSVTITARLPESNYLFK